MHSNRLSFRTWKLLLPPPSDCNASGEQPQHGILYGAAYRQPRDLLSAYLPALQAPHLDFIAHLRIATGREAYFGAGELMALASMPNLGVLEIFELDPDPTIHYVPSVPAALDMPGTQMSPHQVDDRLLKGWALVRPQPFPSLRALRLWGCHGNRLTEQCLQHAATFPKLAHFAVGVYITSSDTQRLMPDRHSSSRKPALWPKAAKVARSLSWYPLMWRSHDFSYNTYHENDVHAACLTQPGTTKPALAQRWGAELYMFLEGQGYNDFTVHEEDIPSPLWRRRDGRRMYSPRVSAVALLSLGVDRSLAYRPNSRIYRKFVFNRSNEAIAAFLGGQGGEGEDAGNGEDTNDANTNAEPLPKRQKKGKGKSIGAVLGEFSG